VHGSRKLPGLQVCRGRAGDPDHPTQPVLGQPHLVNRHGRRLRPPSWAETGLRTDETGEGKQGRRRRQAHKGRGFHRSVAVQSGEAPLVPPPALPMLKVDVEHPRFYTAHVWQIGETADRERA
jgi:hypothetical protein